MHVQMELESDLDDTDEDSHYVTPGIIKRIGSDDHCV